MQTIGDHTNHMQTVSPKGFKPGHLYMYIGWQVVKVHVNPKNELLLFVPIWPVE